MRSVTIINTTFIKGGTRVVEPEDVLTEGEDITEAELKTLLASGKALPAPDGAKAAMHTKTPKAAQTRDKADAGGAA